MILSQLKFAQSPSETTSHSPESFVNTNQGIVSSKAKPGGKAVSLALINHATRTRRGFLIASSFFFLISIIFLTLVLIGNTYIKPALTSIYFLKMDLSNIIPHSVPNATLINSIARSLGLHDFYQVGLWGFCEGYSKSGVTNCSTPKQLYWFDPVDIILSELFFGATIALPANVVNILKIVKKASNWMFALFFTGTVLTFVSLLVSWTSIYSRWAALTNAILSFLAALTTTAATIIATVMFIIFRNVFDGEPQINIKASLGKEMFAFMWIAAGSAILGSSFQIGMCCCCTTRRDVTTGRKKAKRPEAAGGTIEEKAGMRRRMFFRR